VLEPLRPKEEGDQSHMARIHGLQGEPSCRTIEVGIGDEVFNSVYQLLQKTALNQPQFEHFALLGLRGKEEEEKMKRREWEMGNVCGLEWNWP